MIKIHQKVLSETDDLKNGINYKDENINTDHIRLKINDLSQHVGLFLNNNPYLIIPDFNNEGYWELDTKNNIWISSIKFDLNTITSVLVEAFYEEE